MIKIKSFARFSGLGKRSNNEDNFGYIEGKTYVVCDGVGGAEKGEIASDIVVGAILEAYERDAYLSANDAVVIAEDKLSEYINSHPESHGMATTLTLLQIRPGGVYVAWVGDSRIYQFREGQIIYATRDHSWVNEAVDAGILTAEEAVDHPKSNVITRAVQGSHKPVQPQDKFIANVRAGDFFLLCSDGVLESWSDDDLQALFSSEGEPEKLSERLLEECGQNSKDNHTGIVLRVGEIQISAAPMPHRDSVPTVEAIPVEAENLEQTAVNRKISSPNTATHPSQKQHNQMNNKAPKRKLKPVPIALLLITLMGMAWFLRPKEEQDSSKLNQTEKPGVKPAEKPAEEPGEKPEVKPAEKPAEEPAEKTEVKPAEKPAEKSEVKPAVKPAEKPKVKPAEKPAEKLEVKPAEKPKKTPKN